jgi:hypothetical protein
MALLILGLIVFLGTHAFTMARGPRARLIGRIGEGPYKGLYSIVSLAGIVLIAIGIGLFLMIGIAGDEPNAGIGVGGFVGVLGLAFLINSLFERQTPAPASSSGGHGAGPGAVAGGSASPSR